jgi:outer membrane immunogenic protein
MRGRKINPEDENWNPKMNIKNITVAAFAFLASTAALAEPFNGAYFGAQIGWDRHEIIGDGLNYGGFLGYNKKLNDQIVLGIEGSLDFSTAKETQTALSVGQTISATADVGRTFGVSARAGFLAGPNTLFYIKAGYDNVRVKLKTTGNVPGFANLTALSGNIDALVLGGGVEQAINDKMSFRIGYDYGNGKGGYDRHRVLAGVAVHF